MPFHMLLNKSFLIELFYRYLHQSTDEIKELIRKTLVIPPYSIMSLHFLIAEKNIENDSLIKNALYNIAMVDYAKMKYEAGKELID